MKREKAVQELTDEEVVHRYRNSHDTAYVGEIYLRYSHLVFAVCLKYFKNTEAAKDASMQIFEKLIIHLKKHDVQVFKPWLHAVVRNHCMMQFRSKNSEQSHMKVVHHDIEHMENAASVHLDDVENAAEEKEWVLQHLEQGLKTLKAQQQLCLKLFYLEDRSYKDIVAETGFNLQEVKTHIQNGKRNLKIFMDKSNEQKS